MEHNMETFMVTCKLYPAIKFHFGFRNQSEIHDDGKFDFAWQMQPLTSVALTVKHGNKIVSKVEKRLYDVDIKLLTLNTSS